MTENDLARLAAAFHTPLYLFDEDIFAARTADVARAFGSQVRLCYSIKANSFLLSCLPEPISVLEVCSPGELEICKNLSISPSRIIFSGINKTTASIQAALDYGAAVLTAESRRQLELIQAEAAGRHKTAHVLLRLTGGDQFGIDRSTLFDVIEHRDSFANVEITGIHFFSGTQKTRGGKIIRELETLTDLANELRVQYGFSVRNLEYGTGLFSDYFGPDPERTELTLLNQIAPAIRSAAEHFHLTVEMGRFLAASCGTYLTAVNDIKQNDGTCYVILDGGTHHLHYDGQVMGMRLPPINIIGKSGAVQSCTLCGSLCASSDRLAQNIALPMPDVGDILAFHRVGAYSITEGPALFLSRELPRVVLYSESRGARLIRDFVQTYPRNYGPAPE